MEIQIPDRLKQRGIKFVLLMPQSKKPFQKDWQKQTIEFDSPELVEHIKKGGNYGVMGGGEKNILVIDFDNEAIQNQIVPLLPKTFTVKTGKGMLHKYFFSDNSESFKIFDEKMNTLADVQGDVKQVVGAGSVHPNGNVYQVFDDTDIAFLPRSEILALLTPYDKKPKKEMKEPVKPKFDVKDDFLEVLKSALSMKNVLEHFGVDTSRNPTACPFHASAGGKCLGFNNETAHCFHCDGSWNIYSFVKDMKKCEFKEAMEYLSHLAGLDNQLKESRENFKKDLSDWMSKAKSEVPAGEEAEDTARIFTRIGQAETFIRHNPMFYDKSGLWWKWNFDGYKYEVVDETDLLNSVMDEMEIDTVNSKARTEIINSLKQVGRRNIPKNIKSDWLQFKDVIFDICTGEKITATPEYFVTNPIPYKLHNNNLEQTPVMDRIFEEWVGTDFVKTLYEILAYCLLPAYPISRIFCFVGAGLNGKSKFLELLRKFVGDYNCCSTELDTLISSRFEITRLHKKLVCQMGETNFNEMDKTSMLKKLTGDDLIGFEYKNKNPFDEKNYAKILIATNNLPTTTDKTIGFYRRWMIIDFPNLFSEARNILLDIPEEEYESLALKCTIILHDLLQKRAFHKEGSIEERKERYEAKSDFLQKFLDEFTTVEINGHIGKTDFFKKFKDWCHENRHREMAENTLGKKMKEKGIETGKKYCDWLYDGRGGQMWIWEGLKWK